ncbi:MAG TPA: 16S rRNA (uracil(1498)-N(3))-methyltransferase [Clostridiales bacterium]|nr:16S rRNA (uracil(1498)-N(3))-methyltransferase [Clostridiales bacterium]
MGSDGVSVTRFYIEQQNIADGKILIKGKDVNHILKVLRKKENDMLELCNSDNLLYNGHITSISQDFIEVTIDRTNENITEPATKLTILQCIPKGDKMAVVIQKCVELGAFEVVPVLSERCVSRPENKKVTRWNAISEEAAKQCKRGRIPKVSDISEFNHAVDLTDTDLKIICYELEKAQTLHDLNLVPDKVKTISVLVGPEGGLSEKEVEYACKKGFVPVSLGKRILRTETAAPTVAGIIMFCMNEI